MDEDDFNTSIRPSLRNEVNCCTPDRPFSGATAFSGSVVAAGRWKDTQLVEHLRKTFRVIFTEETGIVDFRLQDGSVVVYMPESSLVFNTETRRKLVKLRNMKNVKGFVIAELTNFSEDYYYKMQCFAVLDLGLTVLPVSDQSEAALLLSRMASLQSGMSSNAFKKKKTQTPSIDVILAAIQTIPGLGEKKAKLLLEEFGSLKNVSEASVHNLAPIIGPSKANDVFRFFH